VRAALLATVALVLVAVVAGGFWVLRPEAGGGGTEAAPAATVATSKAPAPAASQKVKGVDYGVATTTEDCPAAGFGGRCIVDAECWSGMVVILGKVTIERRPCEEAHSWETFAVAPLPQDALTSDQQALGDHPAVRKLCDQAVLLKSLHHGASDPKWRAEVLPPSERAYEDGVRVYRCVANNTGVDEATGSAFTG
jgi:hypothetical protein